LPHSKTYLKIFTHHFLPFAWLETILLVMMSAKLEREKMAPLTLGELMQYIGMRLLMLMLQGWSLEEYWYYYPVPRPQEKGPCPY
jgi:hypothetical protein